MTGKDTFYVTTPIYYTNGPPHIGGAYTTIAADVLARWNRLLGKKVYFLTGTDEHGQKIQESARKAGKTPKAFVDGIAAEFKEVFKLLNISNDEFVRTTDSYHEKEVQQILSELYKKKYIYKGFYEAHYCVGCEQYKTESELVDGKCPLHHTPVETHKEEAYLFKLSQFGGKLLSLIKKGELNIQPKERRAEIISFLEEGLKDISISRLKEKISWGIELPFDKKHTCFVWVDAFWNYISGLKTPANKKTFWPVNVQLMAKDIIRVHATIWPALLLALDRKLPKTLFVHGYFTINGEKMSKSLGNAISPIHLTQQYGVDTLRYYLMRGISFGQDGDFSESALVDRHNNELANKLGNLVSRVSALAETYGLEKTPLKRTLFLATLKKFENHMQNLELDRALNEAFAFIDACNQYIQDKKPWETHDTNVLYELVHSLRDIAILLSPFMPSTSEHIAKTFGFELSYKQLSQPIAVRKIKKAEVLFKKIEMKAQTPAKSTKKEVTSSSGAGAPTDFKKGYPDTTPLERAKLPYDDFAKLELKVGTILSVKEHPNADKLYVLEVDVGEVQHRQIVAGLRTHYTKEQLKGKQAVFIVNLAPATIRGVQSQGMILAAGTEGDKEVVFIAPEHKIATGSKIR